MSPLINSSQLWFIILLFFGLLHPSVSSAATQDEVITDTSFAGGGTDGKGHIIRGTCALIKSIALGGRLFVNERDGNPGESEDYNRLMVDIQFKY